MPIRDCVALVTGANRGIGRALVTAILDRGATRVYAAARSLSSLHDLPRGAIPVQLDVTREDEFSAAAALAPDVNLLINNAGVLELGAILGSPLEAFNRSMAVNFFGVLSGARAFAPILISNRGVMVNVLTVVALASMPGFGVYTASKAAAWSLTQSLRAELSGQGVRVVGVFPGAVDTDMLRGMVVPKTPPDQLAAAIADGIDAGLEDIFPDPASREIYAAWVSDHKAVERRFSGQ